MTFAVYMAMQVSISVGLHRFFTHRAFECSVFWQYLFSFIGTLSFHASPIAFVHAHHTHHKHSDTPKDAHVTDWTFFFVRRYRVSHGMNSRALLKLVKDPIQRMLLNYGALMCVVLFLVLLAISPMVALFGYVIPVGMYFLFTAVHQTFSHWGGEPHDWQWLELVIPSSEWKHAYHHQYPSRWDWGWLDLGTHLIRVIKK